MNIELGIYGAVKALYMTGTTVHVA
jgi:hypothetical protein